MHRALLSGSLGLSMQYILNIWPKNDQKPINPGLSAVIEMIFEKHGDTTS